MVVTLFCSAHDGTDGLPCERGGNMVTFEALTSIFTFGLLIVAIIAAIQSKYKVIKKITPV